MKNLRYLCTSVFSVCTFLIVLATLAWSPQAKADYLYTGQTYVLSTNASELPQKITVGLDGNLWFTTASATSGVNEIGQITPSGSITRYSLGAIMPNVIKVGPDGNLWFSYQTGKPGAVGLGTISYSGAVTYPSQFSNLNMATAIIQMAVGSDGNFWIVTDNGYLYRLTMSGQLTQYAGSKGISDMVLGPDGNVWFSSISGAIGYFMPSGGQVVYTIPYSGFQASSIAVGRDGNLWFTAQNSLSGPCIGKVTTSGAYTLYTNGCPLAGGSQSLANIIGGSDGNLWFIYAAPIGSTVKVGSISTTGTIQSFGNPINLGNLKGQSVLGPDGNVWMANNGGSLIARFTIEPPLFALQGYSTTYMLLDPPKP
jgi:streptogramin lyase